MADREAVEAATARRVRRYEWLLRAYPRWWRAQHGEVMLGTLLDASTDFRVVSRAWEAADLVRHGSAVRVQSALPAAVRSSVASVALGFGLAFSLADLAVYGWNRVSFWQFGIGGLLWFPAAWILLALASFAAARNWWVRALAYSLAVAVFIAVPYLHLGPLITVPWSTTFYSKGGPIPTQMLGNALGLVWRQGISPSAANDAVQALLATVALVGRPRLRPTGITVAVAGPLLGLALALVSAGAVFSTALDDDAIWRWPELATPVGPAVGVLTVAFAVAALGTVRKHPTAAALSALGVLALLTGTIALNLEGPTWIALSQQK